MKKVLFFTMAAVAIAFAACKNDDEPSNNNANTPASTVVPGVLTGEFSVGANKKVHFSQGNLQATTTDLGTNWTWAFAEHQWDYIGNNAANNAVNGDKTVSTNGTVDLFGWSTPATYYGIHNSTTNTDYSGNFKEWGDLMGAGWRTLEGSEWEYLLHERPNYEKLFALGSIAGINGLILLPDNWVLPNGLTFNPSTEHNLAWQTGDYYSNSSVGANNFNDNAYLQSEWAQMEAAGAVFLPVTADRDGASVSISGLGKYGGYWSSTLSNNYIAMSMVFFTYYLYPQVSHNRSNGLAVRLVR